MHCAGVRVPILVLCRDADTLAWRQQNDVDSYLFRSLSPEKEASLRRHQHNGHIGTDKQVDQDAPPASTLQYDGTAVRGKHTD